MAGFHRKARGSYTIEASIWIPLLLFIMAGAMRMGVDLYTGIREAHEEVQLEELRGASDFYKSYWIGEIIHE